MMTSPDHSQLSSGWDTTRPWFHGSPYKIELLLAGSTVTQDEELARVFSHKPQIVCLEDDPDILSHGIPRLRHNGMLPGLLYVIDETLAPGDIYPHPRSSMPPGLEWLTRRPVCLHLLGPVVVDQTEFLTPADIDEMMKKKQSVSFPSNTCKA